MPKSKSPNALKGYIARVNEWKKKCRAVDKHNADQIRLLKQAKKARESIR